ncbi:MAG TPA: Lrp/AsnC family transcriptional regulator [Acidimicrobiales bacterium]|nr:Lrp/AsnC family transcriptional regulator [Acidimicrobiales bacterium]
MTLDAVDRRIVELLVADGRMSVNELAAQAHVSRATAYARLERLRADGVITGFTATVDPAKLGYSIAALVLVSVEQSQWREVREEVLRLPGLEYLAFTSGAFDLVLLVRLPGIGDLRDVVLVRLHDIPGIRTAQTIFVLDEARVSPLW